MENNVRYQALIKQLITQHAEYLNTTDMLGARAVFDDEHGEYLLLHVGWNGITRIQTIVLHILLRAGKVFIERDGLPPPGAALELIDRGIHREDIVLAFLHPQEREFSDFAVA